MKAKDLFNESAQQIIVKAIEKAELNTSGEIRFHVEDKCKGDVLDRTAFIFKKLEMHKTALRNGVLFYISISDRKFALIGDGGINKVVPDDFWESTKELVLSHLKKGEIVAGIKHGIILAGEQLKAHFPYQDDDENELSNEVSFG